MLYYDVLHSTEHKTDMCINIEMKINIKRRGIFTFQMQWGKQKETPPYRLLLESTC